MFSAVLAMTHQRVTSIAERRDTDDNKLLVHVILLYIRLWKRIVRYNCCSTFFRYDCARLATASSSFLLSESVRSDRIFLNNHMISIYAVGHTHTGVSCARGYNSQAVICINNKIGSSSGSRNIENIIFSTLKDFRSSCHERMNKVFNAATVHRTSR